MNRLKTIKTEEILTGGKTRQKRNGPGGSGCFHAFCYFLRTAGADLVHDSTQTLALSSTGTTSLGSKAPPASVPISISHRRKKLTTEPRGRAFRRQFLPISTGIAGIRDSQESCCSPGRFHPIKTPSRKRRVLTFSCYSLPRPLPRPATRRSTSVSFISSDTIMPSISSSFSTSSSGKRFRIRWQTMLM